MVNRTFATLDDLANLPTEGVQDIANDTDTVPYLTGAVGTPGSEIASDTDTTPYLV